MAADAGYRQSSSTNARSSYGGSTFRQVESDEQKEQAGALIREYLEWLNERVKRDYGIEFDVKAMVESDLSDADKFRPPDGRFYLAQYDNAVAGVGCLKKLAEGVGEIQRMYVLPTLRGKGIGRAIVNRLVDDARMIGYRQLKLRVWNSSKRRMHSTDPSGSEKSIRTMTTVWKPTRQRLNLINTTP